MYVMVDLSQRDKVLTSTDEDTEIVLLAITYNGLNKILTVNPDFTDDHCYTITNSSGIRFNYWLEHVSEKQSSLELQQQQNESRKVSMYMYAYIYVCMYFYRLQHVAHLNVVPV